MAYIDQTNSQNLTQNINQLNRQMKTLTNALGQMSNSIVNNFAFGGQVANQAINTTAGVIGGVVNSIVAPRPQMVSPQFLYAPSPGLIHNIAAGFSPTLQEMADSTYGISGLAGKGIGAGLGYKAANYLLNSKTFGFLGGYSQWIKLGGMLGGAYLGNELTTSEGIRSLTPGPTNLGFANQPFSMYSYAKQQRNLMGEKFSSGMDEVMLHLGQKLGDDQFMLEGAMWAMGTPMPYAMPAFIAASMVQATGGDYGYFGGEKIAERITKRNIKGFFNSHSYFKDNKLLKKQDASKYQKALFEALKEATDTTETADFSSLYTKYHSTNYKEFTEEILDSGALNFLMTKQSQGGSKVELKDLKNFKKDLKESFETIIKLAEELNITKKEAAVQMAKIKQLRMIKHPNESFAEAKFNFFADLTASGMGLGLSRNQVYSYMNQMKKMAHSTGIGTENYWAREGENILFLAGQQFSNPKYSTNSKEGDLSASSSLANKINYFFAQNKEKDTAITMGIDLDYFKKTGKFKFDESNYIKYLNASPSEKFKINQKRAQQIKELSAEQKEFFYLKAKQHASIITGTEHLHNVINAEAKDLIDKKHKELIDDMLKNKEWADKTEDQISYNEEFRYAVNVISQKYRKKLNLSPEEFGSLITLADPNYFKKKREAQSVAEITSAKETAMKSKGYKEALEKEKILNQLWEKSYGKAAWKYVGHKIKNTTQWGVYGITAPYHYVTDGLIKTTGRSNIISAELDYMGFDFFADAFDFTTPEKPETEIERVKRLISEKQTPSELPVYSELSRRLYHHIRGQKTSAEAKQAFVNEMETKFIKLKKYLSYTKEGSSLSTMSTQSVKKIYDITKSLDSIDKIKKIQETDYLSELDSIFSDPTKKNKIKKEMSEKEGYDFDEITDEDIVNYYSNSKMDYLNKKRDKESYIYDNFSKHSHQYRQAQKFLENYKKLKKFLKPSNLKNILSVRDNIKESITNMDFKDAVATAKILGINTKDLTDENYKEELAKKLDYMSIQDITKKFKGLDYRAKKRTGLSFKNTLDQLMEYNQYQVAIKNYKTFGTPKFYKEIISDEDHFGAANTLMRAATDFYSENFKSSYKRLEEKGTAIKKDATSELSQFFKTFEPLAESIKASKDGRSLSLANIKDKKILDNVTEYVKEHGSKADVEKWQKAMNDQIITRDELRDMFSDMANKLITSGYSNVEEKKTSSSNQNDIKNVVSSAQKIMSDFGATVTKLNGIFEAIIQKLA